jgi:hypothetical protein
VLQAKRHYLSIAYDISFIDIAGQQILFYRGPHAGQAAVKQRASQPNIA